MKIIYLSLFISLSPYDFNNTPHEFLHRRSRNEYLYALEEGVQNVSIYQ